MNTATARGHTPPSDFLALTEAPRALAELASFVALRPALSFLPHGDGHPVMVLPGFLASDSSTAPMRRLLKQLGYDVAGWELGRNVRLSTARIRDMSDGLRRLYERSGRKVSLIGWSLGGMLARELAKMHPEMVRQVISLGSPLTDHPGVSKVRVLFDAINGDVEEVRREMAEIDTPPPVPSTSVYTKADGVVAWTGSLQEEGATRENVEVHASHIGLGVNPSVMWVIADRLAQPEGTWAPFVAKGCASWAFPAKRTLN